MIYRFVKCLLAASIGIAGNLQLKLAFYYRSAESVLLQKP